MCVAICRRGRLGPEESEVPPGRSSQAPRQGWVIVWLLSAPVPGPNGYQEMATSSNPAEMSGQ